jgi:hypothetical protein
MANAAEFLARWTVRYINAEGRIPEELETTVAECVEDANEDEFHAGHDDARPVQANPC